MRIAIMQPYFFPYAGYFRLFAATDLFVMYDCVQFPRRGWVHRNSLPDANGKPAWLTLPLAKAHRDVRIDALSFVPGAETQLGAQISRFPSLAAADPDHTVMKAFGTFDGALPVHYLEHTLRTVCNALGLPFNTVRSSSLEIPPDVRGQDRILAIARKLEADVYVNSPGGQSRARSPRFW